MFDSKLVSIQALRPTLHGSIWENGQLLAVMAPCSETIDGTKRKGEKNSIRDLIFSGLLASLEFDNLTPKTCARKRWPLRKDTIHKSAILIWSFPVVARCDYIFFSGPPHHTLHQS